MLWNILEYVSSISFVLSLFWGGGLSFNINILLISFLFASE